MSKKYLRIEDGNRTIDNPTKDDIEVLIHKNTKILSNNFLVLSKDDYMEYVQCSYSLLTRKWHLEKNEETENGLITYTIESLKNDEIQKIFSDYIDNVSWENLCVWNEPKPLKFCLCQRIIMFIENTLP